MGTLKSIFIDQTFATITVSNELGFNFDISSSIGIDLSRNLLHREIPTGFSGLLSLEYLNLSYNFLDGQIPGLEKMQRLRILDLSHNSLSGQIPENISSLRNLTLLNLSYNCFSGIVPKEQGYWRFPGAFAGNPELCVESSGGKCEMASIPTVPAKAFKEEMEDGPISVWVFGVSAIVSFYSGVVSMFCSARARNYIMQTKV